MQRSVKIFNALKFSSSSRKFSLLSMQQAVLQQQQQQHAQQCKQKYLLHTTTTAAVNINLNRAVSKLFQTSNNTVTANITNNNINNSNRREVSLCLTDNFTSQLTFSSAHRQYGTVCYKSSSKYFSIKFSQDFVNFALIGSNSIFESKNNFVWKRLLSSIDCKVTKMAPKLAPTVKLNNGYEMPVLGLGTYELKKLKCENAISQAIDIGYRHFDTAYLYRNEAIVGKTINQKIEQGAVRRSELFIVTKLWNIYHETERVEYACRMQLKLLGLDYIDLYLMHSPVGYQYVDDEALMPHCNEVLQTNDIDYVSTYKAMENLVKIGLVRSIGVSNFNCQQIQRIIDECDIKPVTNQVECHPALNQRKMIEFCQKHDIIVTAYSPLIRPKPHKPLPAIYRSDKVQIIAEKYNKTVPQIILRYLSLNNEAEIAVKHAIDIGYRHIDTAYFYKNEEEIGRALKAKIDDGTVKREDLFIVTKLWNIYHDPERVEGACRKQLGLLGLEYVDLYLMHLPVGYKYVDEETLLPKNDEGVLQLSDVDYVETYKAMEKLVELGLARSIGISNFNSEQVQRILDCCTIKPVTNQVECSPALNQKKLTAFCKQHDITVTAYSPLGRPKPDAKTPDFIFSPQTKTIADKYNKTPAQVVLRYLLDIGVIPIPKSSNPKRIEENFNVFDFQLTTEELAIMDCFHTGERLVPFNLIKAQQHKYWPFAIEF